MQVSTSTSVSSATSASGAGGSGAQIARLQKQLKEIYKDLQAVTTDGSLDAKALYGAPGSGGTGSRAGSGGGSGLEMSGWRFESQPTVEAVDDNPGVIRFKIKISDDGEVEAVTKVSGNVSAAQEKLCRDKLLDANFVRTNSGQGGATGFYTFRFTVR